jgi:hypothetical protein
MQCLAQDVAELAELWEEVTWARAATVMSGAHVAHVDGLAQEKTVILVTTRGEASGLPGS